MLQWDLRDDTSALNCGQHQKKWQACTSNSPESLRKKIADWEGDLAPKGHFAEAETSQKL